MALDAVIVACGPGLALGGSLNREARRHNLCRVQMFALKGSGFRV